MLSLLTVIAALTLHFGKSPKSQTPDTIRHFLLQRGLSVDNSYAIAPTVLKAAAGTGRGFPLVQVFTAEGTLIFQEDGYTLGMSKRLHQALQKSQPVSGGVSLAEQLKDLRTFDGKSVAP